jgi:hypothetical protein
MLSHKTFLVKERVAFLKLTDTFDIFDPNGGALLGIARENVGALGKLLRLVVSKRLLPTTVEVREREGDWKDWNWGRNCLPRPHCC